MSEFTGSFFIGGSNSLELIFSSKKDLSANMIIVVDSDLSIFQSKIDIDKTPKFAHIGKERMIIAVEMSGIYIYNIKNNQAINLEKIISAKETIHIISILPNDVDTFLCFSNNV